MDKVGKLAFLTNWYQSNKAVLSNQSALVAAIKADSSVENAISTLYFALFNKTLGGCGNCLADALAELLHYSRKEMQKIVECRFKLKAGVLLYGADNLPMATTANLTDEIAIAYLKDNPRRARLFEVLPDGWEKMIATTAETSENVKTIKRRRTTAQSEKNTAKTPQVKRTRRRRTENA